uniref:non-specific serine/threonine protein kinase n=1 Tax=Parastrongyloides trichosuri TaxID=131310 RepID=A0A0N4ZKE5_PARTI
MANNLKLRSATYFQCHTSTAAYNLKKKKKVLIRSNTKIYDRYVIEKVVNGGNYGQIYTAIDEKANKKSLILKVVHENYEPELLIMERNILMKLRGKPNIPMILASGTYKEYVYIGLERLGKNMTEIRCMQKEKFLSPLTVTKVAIQALSALEVLHNSGYLHRDVKPENLVIGSNPNSISTIYLIDFGMARRYLDGNGKIRRARKTVGFRGSMRYVSIELHKRFEHTPQNDIWSLFYSCIELGESELPWTSLINEDEIMTKKIHLKPHDLCIKMPKGFGDFGSSIGNAPYFEAVNYNKLFKALNSIFTKSEMETHIFEWTKRSSLYTALKSRSFFKKGDRTTADGRNKVALKPGRSLNDWIQKHSKQKNLRSESNIVTLEELSQHNKPNDCWIILNGKVYDVTEYLEYHPGGVSEITNYAGMDATEAFIDIHSWVNYNGFLKNYCMGTFKGKLPKVSKMKSIDEDEDYEENQSMKLIEERKFQFKKHSMKSFEITSPFWKTLRSQCLSHYIIDDTLHIRARDFRDDVYSFTYHPASKLYDSMLNVQCENDKIIINSDIPLPILAFNERKWRVSKNPSTNYVKGKLLKKEKITHDTFYVSIQLLDGAIIGIPEGHHVALRLLVRNNKLSRPYTPIRVNESKIEFLIKIYDDGLLTPTIGSLQEGDTLEVSDTIGKLDFINGTKNNANCLCLAAGTGLTPMLRIIEDRVKKGIHTKLFLFNKKYDDIISEKYFPLEDSNFSLTNILSQEEEIKMMNNDLMSNILLGYIRKEIFDTIPDINKYQVFICGPWKFSSLAEEILQSLGLANSNIHVFDG